MLGNTPIAMGYVQREYAQPGTDLLVYNEPGGIAARVTALPHWAAPPQAAS
jgi:glycine cleavage system aminomethyltransferase T